MLLTRGDRLEPEVAAELGRLGVGTVYLVGGEGALTVDVADDVADLGLAVERLAGRTRTETATVIATEVFATTGQTTDLLLARSDDFADALSAANLAAALGAPLVLTPTGQLAPAAARAITDNDPTTVWIMGGRAAVSRGVERAVDELVPTVERLGGADRYRTAVVIASAAEEAGLSVMPTLLASGANFPDAIGAGPAAAALGGRLLLARPGGDNADLLDVLDDDADDLDRVVISGGPGALPLTLDPAVLTAITAVGEFTG